MHNACHPKTNTQKSFNVRLLIWPSIICRFIAKIDLLCFSQENDIVLIQNLKRLPFAYSAITALRRPSDWPSPACPVARKHLQKCQKYHLAQPSVGTCTQKISQRIIDTLSDSALLLGQVESYGQRGGRRRGVRQRQCLFKNKSYFSEGRFSRFPGIYTKFIKNSWLFTNEEQRERRC